MSWRRWSWIVLAALAGCAPAPPAKYALKSASSELDPKLKQQIEQILLEHCGTPQRPKLLGDSRISAATLQLGQDVYARNCQQCHGVTGDGLGLAAPHLRPRPRDYRAGVFKFTSTPYGAKPRRDDLARTIRQGIVGTSMPSFARLPRNELDAVVDYVMALTRRGELENLLILEADSSGELPDDVVATLITDVVTPWREAERQEVLPAVPEPPRTAESIARGRQIFETRECFKCHGADGRGQIASNVGVDFWQHPTRAADLTSGMLRGGDTSLDIYRRISSGINGTPMPAFRDSFAEHPEQIWDLVHFVQDISNARRRRVAFVPSATLGKTHLTPDGQITSETELREPAPTTPEASSGG